MNGSPSSAERSFWLVVSSPANFRATRELDFRLQGIKSRHHKKVAEVQAGDRMLWYLTRLQVFPAAATVTGEAVEEATPSLWRSEGKPDAYPWRVPIRPDLVVEEERGVPVLEVKDRLSYLRKWPAEHWRLGFQGMLHAWPEADFRVVEEALRLRASPASADR